MEYSTYLSIEDLSTDPKDIGLYEDRAGGNEAIRGLIV